jgi:hypothetical protein
MNRQEEAARIIEEDIENKAPGKKQTGSIATSTEAGDDIKREERNKDLKRQSETTGELQQGEKKK